MIIEEKEKLNPQCLLLNSKNKKKDIDINIKKEELENLILVINRILNSAIFNPKGRLSFKLECNNKDYYYLLNTIKDINTD
ncbi:hypothetical protein V6O07_01675 [Arthrospira platensis SPKY2]